MPMSSIAPIPAAPATLDDDAWEDLLNFIEERRVIPIIGPELLKVETETGPRLLYDWIAEKLAGKLSVDIAQLPQPYTLNDVVCWFLVVARPARGGLHAPAQHPARREFRAAAGAAPARADHRLRPLRHDDLRSAARAGDQRRALRRRAVDRSHRLRAQPRRRPADRARPAAAARSSITCSGGLSASPTYVISDEDTLEFICALQSEHLTPEKLFHELEHNHLLFIGSNFTNWLARLFLRMAKRHRLSDPRDVGEVLADNHSGNDERLMAFLQQVSVRTRIYSGAEKFVDELHRRWMTRRGPGEVIAARHVAPQRFLPPEREMPDNAVFISYAREDLPAVQKLKAGLDAAGVTTWFDLERLEGGDDYDRKIQRNIARCSYFIPVVSATTERRLEGYFRREWSYAIDRARNMADGALFILPVCIDDTDGATAQVPDKFKARALHAAARRRSLAGVRAPHARLPAAQLAPAHDDATA